MAKKALIEKSHRKPKYPARQHNRCRICGRPKAYIRYFAMCRICFREHAHRGFLPGVVKASW
ncbi:MAG: type Z 30S ribosomal protein S14 [Dehalococcoidia bacterium]|nr:type Z 30S ribosomal protein S14 [Dehalococcoidia bacterium]MCA9823914.1 type Z 30S ribosomal protein S14 [Dehalococcoidia bacterium]MCA9844054.1 type Z 30S ribosomal protein S14 [Dehalococcoidia bacterium]MCA9853566.1 type Z 30S ribosomal protein S14 [Dehalococcoidia bacterium]